MRNRQNQTRSSPLDKTVKGNAIQFENLGDQAGPGFHRLIMPADSFALR
jgi:hypothetical protein